jgi:GTP diphosphokinase / guanosine-3',5'-bis(diphosphate) 3'-diphosphatase
MPGTAAVSTSAVATAVATPQLPASSSIEQLATQLASYLEPDHIQLVKRAYYYAEQAHDGQRRRSGEAYVSHPLAVAEILANMHMDHQSLMAAMLHDVIEDTGITRNALAEQFGEPVANLVDGVSKLAQIKFGSRAEAQAENFQKMALAMAKDIRVIMVKLADRLHNMRTLGVLRPEKRRRIAKETLEIYAPIANRLGMNMMRVEFEELGFAALYPLRSSRIRAAVRSIRGNRRELIEQIRERIQNHFAQERIQAKVVGREKHLYSIYQKMRTKRKSFSEIMDVFAFRIVVDRVDTCYRVLGAIHSLYKPVPGLFKDYIAIPKSNGYQSLHTVLFGINGIPIEIQIRTQEMEDMANNGIAAHWMYKAGKDRSEQLSGSHRRAREWVQSLLEMQERTGNSLEFIENVKIDLFPDEVYVFTPKGAIMELPQGSTPVDFAYAVHTDVGARCVAARINRRLAPLSEPLQSGQTVEVITSPSAQPNPAWLNFVVTGKARSNIRHFLKHQRHNESIELGQRLLNKALHSLGGSIDALTEPQINVLLKTTGHRNFDYILEDIGLGNRAAFVTARQLIPEQQPAAQVNPSGAAKAARAKTTASTLQAETATEAATDTATESAASSEQTPLVINGSEGSMITFARCCHPIPGDPIIGHISAGRGIVVHADACNNLQDVRANRSKNIPLVWADDIDGEFLVELRVELEQTRGIVATLAAKIHGFDANIEKISVEEKDARYTIVQLEISVQNRVHLARIMRRIRTIMSVQRVSRFKNTRGKTSGPAKRKIVT